MDKKLIQALEKRFSGVSGKSIEAVLELSDEGATVPFIARYRKEKTGNLDEVQIRSIIEMRDEYVETEKRRVFVLKEIAQQGNLTPELQARIEKALDLGELEEIYRPFKKKKKTKATVAREAGLEPLADWIKGVSSGVVEPSGLTLEMKAKEFIRPAASIVTYDMALKGAQDILVEAMANDLDLRIRVKDHLMTSGVLESSRAKEFKANSKFSMYAEFRDEIKKLLDKKNSHRYMAMRRGWQEGELQLAIKADEEPLVKAFEAHFIKKSSIADEYLKIAAKLALTVYTLPSVHNEIHKLLKDSSDVHAIDVFTENVRTVLLSPAFGAKCVLGVDPGIRTGCKLALIDRSGRFISHTVLKVQGDQAEANAHRLFKELTQQIQLDAVAVGNGTGGREAEVFLRKVFKQLEINVPIVLVNESGASVYSASDIAREEFPDLDITVRGAISIARRLQDPLSELVKIDPKSIGVGQYQHDLPPGRIKKSLHDVVESCVNMVGVEVNTASESLLSYVAGIGPSLAKNIVEHRQKNGLIKDRSELLKVPKFSSKAYEQAAGFLRIRSGLVKLDATGIHPERYQAVKDMLNELDVSLSDVMGAQAQKLLALRTKWSALIGEYTFNDIVAELEKPGRDPRNPYEVFSFREDLFEVKDVQPGMICPGIVTNVTNFGAFVDIGVHQDGLVHISELTHDFVSDPRQVVSPGDKVKVKVLSVDAEKSQLSFSMKLEERKPVVRAPAKAAEPNRAKLNAKPNSKQHGANNHSKDFKRDSTQPNRKAVPEKPKKIENLADRPQYQRAPDRKPADRSQKSPFNNPFAALLNQDSSKSSSKTK